MRTIGLFLTLSLSLLAAQAVAEEACRAPACDGTNCGSPDCCARCGRHCGCTQCTCQLTCGMEKYKKYCWEVKCSEFCPLLPTFGCGERKSCCENTGKCGEKCPNPIIRTPTTANARVHKELVKKEYECERPKYKTVVQYLCPECASCGNTGAVTPTDTGKPAAPAPAPTQVPEAPQPKTTYVTPLPPTVGAAY